MLSPDQEQELRLSAPSGFLTDARWKLSANQVAVEVEGKSYATNANDGFTYAIEALVGEASQDFGASLTLLHCAKCVHYQTSGMAKQMSNDFAGNCSLHKAGVYALYWCQSLLLSERFACDWVPPQPKDSDRIRREALSAIDSSRPMNIYPNGTIALGLPEDRSRRSRPSRLSSAADKPQYIQLAKLEHSTLVNFGDDATYSIVFDNEGAKDEIDSANRCSLLRDHDVCLALGLMNLTSRERFVAITAFCRLRLDAKTPISVESSGL